ncbi:glucose 1-dehydrogenase [Rhizobium sp. LjRoot30]|uniref:SDR family NAD(P)-dependent oxidoreductase n=1 Tax=Rhizobium sp. LjRoot30 TaxID=3342320 RepID=UPI003ECF7A46
MSNRLQGKVAVVTGGTTGIGLGIARQFAAEGATVFITGRRQQELDAAVKDIGGNVTGVRGDISDLADLDRLFDTIQQKVSHIDILAANAGGGTFAPLGSITEEDFDKTFSINVKGTLFTVQKALPLLRDGGSIILTSSTSTTRAIPAFSVYGATKAAIRNFARHWILDLKDRNIRVNAISPGPTLTPGLTGLTSSEEQWKQFEGSISAQIPLGRLADPNEIGRAAVFLASDDASFVNGIELFVDGGMAQI